MISFSSPTLGLLGQPFGSQAPYRPVLRAEEQKRSYNNGTFRRVKLKCIPITFMDQYANKSFEEIRLEDYSVGRKRPLGGIPKKDEDLTIAMVNFIPQTYTVVSDIKMTDPNKISSSTFGRTFGSLNNCFGTSSTNSLTARSSNSFGDFSSTPPTSTFFQNPSSSFSTPATPFNFQTSPVFSNSVNTKPPIFSFNNNTTSIIPPPPLSPATTTIFSMPQLIPSSQPLSNSLSLTPQTFSSVSPTTSSQNQGSSQIGTPFRLPTNFGPKLYPIFNGPNLVGYTLNDIAFNPSSTMIRNEKAPETDEKVTTAWKEFYDHSQTNKLKLFPTSRRGEFFLDTDPTLRNEGRSIYKAYDQLWNNPLNNSNSEELEDRAEDKIHSNKYWEPLDLKQLSTPYTDSKIASEKCRRTFLSTERIFPSLAKLSQSAQSSGIRVNPFGQDEDETEESYSQPPKRINLSEFPGINGFTKTSFPTTFVVDRMSGTGEAAGGQDKECPKINEKEFEENGSPIFKTLGSDAENVKIIDRSRRPRSKSLSVRPRGKSCGVHLTRDRYYCIPSIQTLDSMVDEYGRCIVENFEVGHMDFGHMVFESKIDVAGINLDEIVVFNLKEMFLYPATDHDCDLPLSLQKLNQPALVTLVQVWPQRHGTNEFIRDLNIINSINYELLLKKTCERMGVTFVSYDPVKGHWLFRIQDSSVHVEE